MFANRKKDNMKIKEIFTYISTLKDRLDIEFKACYSELMPERALTSFIVSDAYLQFAGQA